jgi:hypothetical protein
MLAGTRKKLRAADSRWMVCPGHPGALQAGPYAAVALLDLQSKHSANPRNDDKPLFFNKLNHRSGKMYNVNVGNTQVSNPSP